MAQELTLTSKRIGIIGGGPAGCACAAFLSKADFDITIFDKGEFLRTILPTGGGRCNLAYAQYDFMELAKNYPRGEKFLYSVFSQFGTTDTLKFFKSIGVDTYKQADDRCFPVSNSSLDVKNKILKAINAVFVKEEVISINSLTSGFEVITNKSKYFFDKVVLSIGGHSGYSILNSLGISVIPPVQSLVGLVTANDFSSLAGVSLNNVKTNAGKNEISGDIIFTHKGISGPLIYKISSIFARREMPYKINLNFIENFDFQTILNNNPHKEIKNLISKYIPKSFANYLLLSLGVDPNLPCHKINGKIRDIIYKNLTEFEINIIGKIPDGEVVTSGGIDLKEVNSKTMESRRYKNLYFCGEVLDIDGFCGGFNLQNCWSGAWVCAQAIINN